MSTRAHSRRSYTWFTSTDRARKFTIGFLLLFEKVIHNGNFSVIRYKGSKISVVREDSGRIHRQSINSKTEYEDGYRKEDFNNQREP